MRIHFKLPGFASSRCTPARVQGNVKHILEKIRPRLIFNMDPSRIHRFPRRIEQFSAFRFSSCPFHGRLSALRHRKVLICFFGCAHRMFRAMLWERETREDCTYDYGTGKKDKSKKQQHRWTTRSWRLCLLRLILSVLDLFTQRKHMEHTHLGRSLNPPQSFKPDLSNGEDCLDQACSVFPNSKTPAFEMATHHPTGGPACSLNCVFS